MTTWRECYVLPLSTDTTCYTTTSRRAVDVSHSREVENATRKQRGSPDSTRTARDTTEQLTLSFATSSHVCSLSILPNEIESSNKADSQSVETKERFLFRKSSRFILRSDFYCVGYSSVLTDSLYECLVYLQEEDPINETSSHPSAETRLVDTIPEDTATMPEPSRSSASLRTMAEESMTEPSVMTNRSTTSSTVRQESTTTLSAAAADAVPTTTQAITTTTTSTTRSLLSIQHSAKDDDTKTELVSLSLNHRLVAPQLLSLSTKLHLVAGSPDTNELYWWELRSKETIMAVEGSASELLLHNEGGLLETVWELHDQRKQLPASRCENSSTVSEPTADTSLPQLHPAFCLPSPVLSIRYYEIEQSDRSNTQTVLVAGCQDGTLRVIVLLSDDGLKVPFYQDITVDGPIVALDVHSVAPDSICIVAGSLSGYVAEAVIQFKQTDLPGDNTTVTTDSPQLRLIVPELIRRTCKTENNNDAGEQEPDSCLAVHVSGDLLAVGTESGRILVLQLQKQMTLDQPPYQLIWQCLLPNAVQGLEWLHMRSSQASDSTNATACNSDSHPTEPVPELLLVATTLRSIHVFVAVTEKTRTTETASRVHQHLLQLLEYRQQAHDKQGYVYAT